MYDRLLQRIVRYHHPRLHSLEEVLASAPGPAKSRARGERSRHRQLTDACWACLLEARTSEGVVDVEVGMDPSHQGADGVRHWMTVPCHAVVGWETCWCAGAQACTSAVPGLPDPGPRERAARHAAVGPRERHLPLHHRGRVEVGVGEAHRRYCGHGLTATPPPPTGPLQWPRHLVTAGGAAVCVCSRVVRQQPSIWLVKDPVPLRGVGRARRPGRWAVSWAET